MVVAHDLLMVVAVWKRCIVCATPCCRRAAASPAGRPSYAIVADRAGRWCSGGSACIAASGVSPACRTWATSLSAALSACLLVVRAGPRTRPAADVPRARAGAVPRSWCSGCWACRACCTAPGRTTSLEQSRKADATARADPRRRPRRRSAGARTARRRAATSRSACSTTRPCCRAPSSRACRCSARSTSCADRRARRPPPSHAGHRDAVARLRRRCSGWSSICESTGLPFRTVPAPGRRARGRSVPCELQRSRHRGPARPRAGRTRLEADPRLARRAHRAGDRRRRFDRFGAVPPVRAAGRRPDRAARESTNRLWTTSHGELHREFPDSRNAPGAGQLRRPDGLPHALTPAGPDAVFHAAAYKQVPMLEAQLREAVRNNVLAAPIPWRAPAAPRTCATSC